MKRSKSLCQLPPTLALRNKCTTHNFGLSVVYLWKILKIKKLKGNEDKNLKKNDQIRSKKKTEIFYLKNSEI